MKETHILFFKVLSGAIAVTMNSTTYNKILGSREWVLMWSYILLPPCCLAGGYQRLRETCSHYLQGGSFLEGNTYDVSTHITKWDTAQTIFFILFCCFSCLVSILYGLRDENTSISYSQTPQSFFLISFELFLLNVIHYHTESSSSGLSHMSLSLKV
jgi:hypothetical protein